jgi:flagellar hook-associated protein 3 FlgL
MRITDSYRFATSQISIQKALGQLNEIQRRVSTGKLINQPSDAPLEAALATRLRATQQDAERHLRALGDATAWLSVQDSALQSASSLLARAETLSVQAQNGSLSAIDRDAVATEIEGIRAQLGLIANTRYQGQSAFGAFSSDAIELTDTGAVFNGTPGAVVERRISDSEVIAVNTDGFTAFGFDSGDDVFAVLTRMADNVRAGDAAAIADDTATLRARAVAVRDALGVVGSRAALIESATSRHEDDKISVAARLSEVEDVDVTAAAVQLKQASQAYEAVLTTIAMSQQRSLLDFLR